MLFGGEVCVCRRGADARLRSDHPDGQPGKALAAQDVDGGPAETVDGVGLFRRQPAASRLPSYRFGHMSGRYYTGFTAATVTR